MRHLGRDLLGPQTARRCHEVIQTSDKTGNGQKECLLAALLARNQNLGGCCSLREWVFAVHILDEVLAERNKQHNTKDSTQQR